MSHDRRADDPPDRPTDPPRDWLRGVVEPCLLALLADGEAYGYDLAARLAQAGIGTVPGGSLYPALLRLEKQGHLRSTWRAGEGGPGRKYYRLTASGRRALADQAERWGRFAGAVGQLLDTGAAVSAPAGPGATGATS